ncbi:hypothetical protein WCN79_15225 [Xanthomonas axonopodis pv. vasculorum]|uniref:hypothetical protein n=1 Tax=Xanthomonas axonopodis TaxID=53413 RepID=UPI0010707B21|nr:hypothetical protein [Xanthomonas axonopodis]QKD86356.1 hypothetical protein XAV_08050 [Xanthomonas axonopodis pv. vasculorum]
MINRYGSLERNHMVSRAAIAAGVLLALTVGSAMPAIAQDKDARFQLASVDQQTKSAISRSLKVELQKYIDGQMGRLPDQDAHILVNSVSVTSKGALVVDLSRGFLPRVPGRIEEDRRDQLKSLYVEVIDPTLSADFRNAPVEFTVEGRSFEEWEPGDPTLKPKKN